MSTIKEKLKAVSAALAAIEKQFGKGAIMSLGACEETDVAVFSDACSHVFCRRLRLERPSLAFG